jgi:GLPGLI family protein
MRNIFILLSLLFNLTISAQLKFDYPIIDIEPVELIVNYSLQYQEDSLNPNFIKQEDMVLLLGNNMSKFLSKNLNRSDIIMAQITNMAQFQEFVLDPNKPFPKIGYRIFKNYPKGKLTYIENIPSSTFKYMEDLDIFNWQLTGDTATIKRYKVQKAITDFGGRSWVAWFSPEIPHNDGPYKFNGLPGLILNVHDTRNHFTFELLSIEKPQNRMMIDIVDKDYVETTKSSFFQAEDAFRYNIVSIAKEAGLSSDEQQHVSRNMSERNNPIELKRK